MTDGIEAVTRSALVLALDAASLRQRTSATNVANANTIGYVPQRVSFETQLDEVRQGMATSGQADLFALRQIRPRVESSLETDGRPGAVRLDVEAAEMARNAVHYQALVKGLTRHFALLSMAISDGRK